MLAHVLFLMENFLLWAAKPATAHPLNGARDISPELGITMCLPGSHVTAMPNYDSWIQSRDTTCHNRPTYEQRAACYCEPKVFSLIQGCQSELADCFQDKNAFPMSTAYSQWHDICDTLTLTSHGPTTTTPAGTPASITQPPQTPPEVVWDKDFCLTQAKEACEGAKLDLAHCSSLMRVDATAYDSCTCSPPLLSKAYTCEILASNRCLVHSSTKPKEVTDMLLWSWCPNAESVLGSGIPDATPTPIRFSTPAITTPASPITPAPTIPISTTPAKPTTTSSAAARTDNAHTSLAIICLMAYVVLFI
ncbi:hypothetical protein V8F20_006584 [Naviculisporaceae sp. PSN 640]